MAENQKSVFKYSENHNRILRAIAELMRPEVYKVDTETGEKYSLDEFERLSKEDREDRFFRDDIVEPPFPTSKEIAEKTGFAPGTITKHIQQMTLENFKGTAQALIPQVIAALGRTAIREGKAPEAKLFLQVVGGFEEKSKLDADLSGEIVIKTKRTIVTKSK